MTGQTAPESVDAKNFPAKLGAPSMRVFRVRNTHFLIGLDDSDNVVGLGVPPFKVTAAPRIELTLCNLRERQHLLNGVLAVDGQGFVAILNHVLLTTERPTGRKLTHRLCDIIGSGMHFRERLRSALRVVAGWTHASGAAQLWLDDTRDALARPTLAKIALERSRRAVH